MPNHFDEMFDGIALAANGITIAANGMIQAAEGIKIAARAGLMAHGEQEDLRETVNRLEALVMELIVQKRNESNT